MVGKLFCWLGFHNWFIVNFHPKIVYFVCPRCGRLNTMQEIRASKGSFDLGKWNPSNDN